MIRRIEALRYRSLLHVEQELGDFHVVVGPNAGGKSTLLDALAFLGDLVTDGVEAAVLERAPDWRDLIWKREGRHFELALEADIPEELREQVADAEYGRVRYQIAIGIDDDADRFGIVEEALGLIGGGRRESGQPELFPRSSESPDTIMKSFRTRDTKTVVHKIPGGNDHFYDETGSGWSPTFKLGVGRSALGNLPEDETKFPVATWFKRMLADHVDRVRLDADAMKEPSPPGRGRRFRADGSNLPWLVRRLQQEEPAAFDRFVGRLKRDFPQITSVDTEVRDEDRHCYLRVEFSSGVTVSSWGLSEGTLRVFAFSLLPHLSEPPGVLLVEEPENGVHPIGIRAIYDALSETKQTQVLATTHSPVLLECCEPREVLFVSTDERGASTIIDGSDHATLDEEGGMSELAAAFAAGAFG